MTVESVAFFAIVNHGIGQKVLKTAKEHGTGGGTLVLCDGTSVMNLSGELRLKPRIVANFQEQREKASC